MEFCPLCIFLTLRRKKLDLDYFEELEVFEVCATVKLKPDLKYCRTNLQKGPASNPKNCRPISLTCKGSKMFEKILKSHLMSELQENSLLSKEQHGLLTKNQPQQTFWN